MATITLEVTDEQLERSLRAFGHYDYGEDMQGDDTPMPAALPGSRSWTPATQEELEAGITGLLKNYVVGFEASTAHEIIQTKGQEEQW